MTLGVDYKVKTEASGTATLTFFEGSTIELKGNTEVGLAELGMTETSTTIQLEQTLGETVSRVKKLADPASRYEIETPAAVAAVRGTTMYIGVSEEGNTNVGNIEGSVVVTAQGVEASVPVDSHIPIIPGSPPGEPQPGATVSPEAAAAVTPTPTETVEASPSPTENETAELPISSTARCQKAYPGDTVIYTYTVTNAGDVPLSGVSVTGIRCGEASYRSGDANDDRVLDIGETWVLAGVYIVRPGDAGQLTDTAMASGVSPLDNTVTASASDGIAVESIVVNLKSLKEEPVEGTTISLSGTVNDPSITRAVLTVNGISKELTVNEGVFTATINLNPGASNIIRVEVYKNDNIAASDAVELVPIPVES
jgi:hypothetical protein